MASAVGFKREKRLLVLIIFFTVLSVLIWGRFFYLSIIRHDYYLSKAASRLSQVAPFKRGNIFLTDKDDLPFALALNKDFPLVYAVPKAVKNPEDTAAKLAGLLELDGKSLAEKLAKQGDPYEILKKRVSDEVIPKVKELNLEGIGIDYEIARFYPNQENLAQVTGFLGFNSKGDLAGQYGLEEYYDKTLSGSGNAGFTSSLLNTIEGADLVLTVDSAIQAEAFSLVKKMVEKWQAASGSIVVMNPRDGAIMAMASWPSFDPNSYAAVSEKNIFVNPATQMLFEPGSVMKPLTMAVGLDSGAVTPDTRYFDAGEVQIGGSVVRNSTLKSYGWQTMAGVLEKSLNTGAVFVQQKVPKEVFFNYFKKFELNQKTGIDLPEVKGDLSNLATLRDINYATAAFGQGISMTPIELLRALAAIANGGRMPKPYLVARIVSQTETSEIEPEEPVPVISSETAAKLVTMMLGVVEKGSGRLAKMPTHNIAGKTGTAQVPNIGSSGYSNTSVHSFVGFAPAYNPRFIALVKLDAPKAEGFSESTVVPVFRDLASFIFSYLQIPPDKSVEEKPKSQP